MGEIFLLPVPSLAGGGDGGDGGENEIGVEMEMPNMKMKMVVKMVIFLNHLIISRASLIL